MKVRLAALITACTAALLWYAEPLKSEDLAGTCVSSKVLRSDVIAACTTLIEDPDTTPEHLQLFLTERAWAHKCNDRFERAIADVDRALELQPGNYKTLALRAQIHASAGNHDAALRDYDEAIEIAPNASFTHWKKARYLDEHGDRDEALQGYQRALDLNPKALYAAKSVVRFHIGNGDYEKALGTAQPAARSWPEESSFHNALIRIHVAHTGDATEALNAVSRRFELAPNLRMEMLVRALVHLQIGDEGKGVQIVDSYARHQLSEPASDVGLLERIGRYFWEEPHANLHDQLIGRALVFELCGRRDLARRALYRMFGELGLDGEAKMTNILSREGLKPDVEIELGGGVRLDQLIDQYLDHIEIRLGWLPASKS